MMKKKKKIIIAILVVLAVTAWIIGALIIKSNHGANPFAPGKYPPGGDSRYELNIGHTTPAPHLSADYETSDD